MFSLRSLILQRIFFIFFVMVGVPAAGITLVYVADRALNAVTKCFTMGQDKVKAAFDAFDTDGSGELDLDEFKQAIESLGMNLSDQQFNKLVSQFFFFESFSIYIVLGN